MIDDVFINEKYNPSTLDYEKKWWWQVIAGNESTHPSFLDVF